MRTTMRCLAAAAFAAVAVGLTTAQQPPRQGRGGPGGFGGGMTGGPAMLVGSPAVLDDIKATDDQRAKLKDWSKDYMAKSMEAMKGLRDLSPEERQTKMADATKTAYKEIATVLDEKQVKRVKQISLQQQGVMAALTPGDVQDALKLTGDQKGQLKDVADEMRKDMTELFQGGGRPDMSKMAALRKESTEKAEKVLTGEQKTAWKGLTGEPFDTSKLNAGFGGGRPGGAGGTPGRRPGGTNNNNKDNN